jgi:hypothetical protein
LTPAEHVVSEYANTRSGWLSTVALLSWAASLVATAGWIVRQRAQPRAVNRLVAAFLVVAAGGLIVAAAFQTQAVAGSVPPDVARTLAGRLHDAGTGISTLALFGAVAAFGFSDGAKSRLGRLSLAVVAFAIVVQVGLLLVGQEVGGIRQRLIVIAACAWQAAMLSVRRTTRVL